jgi:outer membrane murein-binding lipoprotein Lpp
MGLGANLAETTAKGLVGTIFNGIFGKNNLEDQEELMRKAWEYEKAGMGLQYNYGQQAADAEYKRNLQMWKDTNFGAQRNEMEKAGLSVGLMYGNGGGQAASTAGGTATQPNAPKTNPVEVGLQQQALGLQLKQIEAQNRLANAETAKTLAEANKIAGVDTEGQDLENKWQEIENRIQLSKENIAAANVTEANANAQKAVELWNQEMLNTKYLNETQEERVTKLVAEIALLQKEGAVQDSIVDVNYNTARKIQKEVENFYYDMITKRMSAEAAKDQAAAMIDKIAKDYELGKGHLNNENQKNLREWIYGGINQLSEILESVSKLKQAKSLLKRLEKVIRKPNE